MAMNKKEQAAYDELMAQARINRALRWSDYSVERDMPVPEVSGEYQNGWSYWHCLSDMERNYSSRHTGRGRGCRCNLPPHARHEW
jgi:hypothetical protein